VQCTKAGALNPDDGVPTSPGLAAGFVRTPFLFFALPIRLPETTP
jgi:hypothetical protein